MSAAMAMTVASAGDGVDGDVRAGYNADLDDALVGGGVLVGLGPAGRWFANPNGEVTFADGGDQLLLSGDFHYDFPLHSTTFWLGGGPAISRRDPDVGDDDTDVGLNLIAGIGPRQQVGRVRPFVQGRVTLKDDSEAAFVVGIRF